MSSSYLALVLHAHLPFVRHPEHEEFLEEDWFFEAITEAYLPLIGVMQRLLRDGVPFQLTMTVSPTLCAMLQDELLRDRYVKYLDRTISLASREIERNRDHERLRDLSQYYHRNLSECRSRFLEYGGDLLGELRKLQDTGCLEIGATAATHGLLPLLQQSTEAVRAQIHIGCDVYRKAFGTDPKGFWLPECAYGPGLENIMQEQNLRWFVVDAPGLMFGQPRPLRAIYGPCFTPAGPAVFARDRESSRQVWSASEGYPGHPAYRDFYCDIGFDLPIEYIWPESRMPAIRRFTGLKYHRITGPGLAKEFYDPADAYCIAQTHAAHFLEARRKQMTELQTVTSDPIVVVPFDAELFGHWWFEGPQFLESLIREMAQTPLDLSLLNKTELELTTPAAFLANHPTQQTIVPAPSSWGENGHLAVWLDDSNSWIYSHLHAAANRMTEIACAHSSPVSTLEERLLQQLARELLLAQSSDWAFLIKTGTARAYATKRVTDHLLRFNRLFEHFTTGAIDENFLLNCEWRDNLFPNLNWRYYLPCQTEGRFASSQSCS